MTSVVIPVPLPPENNAPLSNPSRFQPRGPGSNPNRDNAQRRKGNRPRVSNKPSDVKTPMELRWVEPLSTPIPMSAVGLEENNVSVPAGYVSLRPSLPGDIAAPTVSLFQAVAERTNISPLNVTYLSGKVEAMAYFKAARQLYATLSDHQKSILQPLKAVYYDQTNIPKHMGISLSIIGNFESKLGKVEVRDAPTLFRRWILQGLQIDPDFTFPVGVALGQPLTYVWPDSSGKEMVDRMARTMLQQYHDNDTFAIGGITVSPPLYTTYTQAVYNSIDNAFPNSANMRLLVSLLSMSTAQWRSRAALPLGGAMAAAMTLLGCTLAPVALDDSFLRNGFEDCMAKYQTKALVHVDSLLHTGPPPALEHGFAAQIVNSDDVTGEWSMPLSDADKHVGFMFSPSDSFEMNPLFRAYSRRRRDDVSAGFAGIDAKTLAI